MCVSLLFLAGKKNFSRSNEGVRQGGGLTRKEQHKRRQQNIEEMKGNIYLIKYRVVSEPVVRSTRS